MSSTLSPELSALQTKIDAGTAHIGIYGLGYVGLPLALRFAEVGLKVTGFDIDSAKVQQLNAGGSYIERLPPAVIQRARSQGFEASGRSVEMLSPPAAQEWHIATSKTYQYRPGLFFKYN